MEFITDVKYTLYANKKPILSNLSSNDSITRLPTDIFFDSVAFTKPNYKEIGFRKNNLSETILMARTAYELDEVVIPNTKPKEVVIGEESRFVKKSMTLSGNPDFGLLFRENDLKNKTPKRLGFFVDKVKFRTVYKVKFYSASETGNPLVRQNLILNELLFETPVQSIEEGVRGKVEINLEDYEIDIRHKNVFVSIELQSYYDENNNTITPENKDKTRIKAQLSKQANYYSKMHDVATGGETHL